MVNKLFLCVFLFFVSLSVKSQKLTNKEVEARIDTMSINDIYQVRSVAFNKTEVYKSLRYEFSVIKKNKQTKNSSKNKQEGLFSLEPNQTLVLSQTSINFDKKDDVVVFLLIYEEEKLVGKKVINLTSNRKLEKTVTKKKRRVVDIDNNHVDGVEIRGLVTDDTKTKFGKEFYEIFSNLYREDRVNADKVITVNEKFSLGRRTIVQVYVESNLVYQFLIKPNLEAINAHSKQCLRFVKRFLQREKENAERIKEY